MSIVWKDLKSGTAQRLRCTNSDSVAMEVRAEPVKKKHHTRTATKRRTMARCLACRASKVVAYGARA